jgi:hypothetical protein
MGWNMPESWKELFGDTTALRPGLKVTFDSLFIISDK